MELNGGTNFGEPHACSPPQTAGGRRISAGYALSFASFYTNKVDPSRPLLTLPHLSEEAHKFLVQGRIFRLIKQQIIMGIATLGLGSHQHMGEILSI